MSKNTCAGCGAKLRVDGRLVSRSYATGAAHQAGQPTKGEWLLVCAECERRRSSTTRVLMITLAALFGALAAAGLVGKLASWIADPGP
ncbi:hypothetical protein [Botrimarina sp.]|uniref:hypothetical protein n=1 Tax=Botrimarina sp. TaxID=2795802 RepID=UPI0032EF2A74